MHIPMVSEEGLGKEARRIDSIFVYSMKKVACKAGRAVRTLKISPEQDERLSN